MPDGRAWASIGRKDGIWRIALYVDGRLHLETYQRGTWAEVRATADKQVREIEASLAEAGEGA